jgi:hypothetical protein
MLNKEDALCCIRHLEHTKAIASDCDCKATINSWFWVHLESA